jgi:arabinogalactan oligomer / maltooligosaccharide transport system substrate-binding protein
MQPRAKNVIRQLRRTFKPAIEMTAVSAVSATVAWSLARRRRPGNGLSSPRPQAGEASPPARITTVWANIDADGGDTEPGLWGAMVLNDSDAPIRYAHLTVRHRRDGWVSKEGFHKIAPHTRFKWSAVKVYAHASGGFGPSPVSRPTHGRLPRVHLAWQESSLFALELTFQDSAGRFWLVNEDDEFTEISRDLMIWCDDERYAICKGHIGTEFQPKFGVDVNFETFEVAEELQGTLNRYATRPDTGRTAPDILLGAHDWLGKLEERNAVAEVSLAAHQRDAFEEMAIRTLSRDGRLYGVPYTYDCVALIINADLVGDTPVPETFMELLELGQKYRRPDGRAVAIQMGPVGDIYHLWPVFSSVGGTLAGWCADGTVLPREQWYPAFIEAISALIELRRAAPALLDEKLTRDAAEALFLEGKTPYFISACGRLGHVLDRSIAIRTATVPPLGPDPARSLVTVMTFYLSPYGKNQRIAQDLLTYYLARPDTGIELNRIEPWPPVQRNVLGGVTRVRPELSGFIRAQRDGILMPSHPRIRTVWETLMAAEVQIARGRTDVSGIAAPVVAAFDALDWLEGT